MDYLTIFCNHVTEIMQRKALNKQELAEKAGISVSFISDITTMKANPSLKVMSQIAEALEIPLPLLLLDPTGEILSYFSSWSKYFQEEKLFYSKDKGCGLQEVTAVIPAQKAFLVKQWAEIPQRRKKKK